MTKDTTTEAAVAADHLLFDDWFDAIEDGVRARVRGFIEAMLEEELAGALSRPRYGRLKPGEDEAALPVVGVRHGHRERTLTGTFGKTRIAVPRARLTGADGTTSEWKSASLRAYQRRTKAADALIAGAYLSGTNTRRVRRALTAVFAGPVGKDVVSRAWRKVKGDWDAWNVRPLGQEPIVRLILDGTLVRSGSTDARRRSRSWWRSACARTARRCCWRSAAWAGKARPPGARCSTISSSAD
jgi:transposase-like protein